MYKTRIAIFHQQGREIIVVPLDCSFEDRPASQRRQSLDKIQKAAVKAGLNAPVAAVWRVGNKLHFLAPNEWHPFLKALTWNTIISSLSSTLNCHEGSSHIDSEQINPTHRDHSADHNREISPDA